MIHVNEYQTTNVLYFSFFLRINEQRSVSESLFVYMTWDRKQQKVLECMCTCVCVRKRKKNRLRRECVWEEEKPPNISISIHFGSSDASLFGRRICVCVYGRHNNWKYLSWCRCVCECDGIREREKEKEIETWELHLFIWIYFGRNEGEGEEQMVIAESI